MDIINLTKGEKVIYNDKEVIITKLNTLDTVTIEEVKNESSDDSKEDVNTNEIPNEENSKEQ